MFELGFIEDAIVKRIHVKIPKVIEDAIAVGESMKQAVLFNYAVKLVSERFITLNLMKKDQSFITNLRKI